MKNYITREYEKIAETPMHYGFNPIKTPRAQKEDVAISKKLDDILSPETLSEKVALMRLFLREKMYEKEEPALFYYSKPSRKKSSGHKFSLDVIGSDESIMDALLIQATKASLEAEGFKNIIVDINSMGETDTLPRFEKELGLYLRKHIEHIPDKWRPVFQKNTLEISQCTDETCEPFLKNSPSILNFLTDNARKHFKEVLEYLESTNIPYRIKPSLMSNKNIGNHTVFTMYDQDTDTALARGYRYGKISKKCGSKTDYQCMTSLIDYEHPKPQTKIIKKKATQPLFYFIHLGPSARLKGLKILDMLYETQIPTMHALTKQKISGQMIHAKKSGAKYLLIMGQKEACEDSILIRDMSNWKQESIPLSDLSTLIKRYK